MKKTTKITALVGVLGTLFFAIFDYFGYNISARNGWVNEKFINAYRIVQMIVQVGIAVACYFLGGYIAVIVFMILWWTWTCDWLFYFIGEILGVYGKGYLNDEPFMNKVTWAWWTPFGLIKWLVTGQQQTVIQWQILVVQSLIGILISVLCQLNI